MYEGEGRCSVCCSGSHAGRGALIVPASVPPAVYPRNSNPSSRFNASRRCDATRCSQSLGAAGPSGPKQRREQRQRPCSRAERPETSSSVDVIRANCRGTEKATQSASVRVPLVEARRRSVTSHSASPRAQLPTPATRRDLRSLKTAGTHAFRLTPDWPAAR
jgi:hypothetical protein